MKLLKRKKIIIFLLIVLLVLLLSLASIKLFDKNTNKPMKLNFDNGAEKLNKFDAGIYQKVGWLQVQGTNINMPIITGEIKSTITYSYSWLSPYYNTGDNREELIGHNIINVSNQPMLPNENLKDFEELMAFSYYSFAKDNLYIQYTKDGKDEIYLIYAIGFYNKGDDYGQSYSEKEEVKDYIKKVKENSIYKYSIDVNEDDTLLALKTCTRYFGIFKNQEFMIDARKLRDDEEILKYKVVATKKYKELEKVEKM